MRRKVGKARPHRRHIFLIQFRFGYAAVHFQRAHRGDQHDRVREQSRLASENVKKFFRAQIRAETRLGYDIIRQSQRRPRRDDRACAMCDIRKRAAVHQRRRVFQRLHQIRQHRVFQYRRHCARGVQLFGQNWRTA